MTKQQQWDSPTASVEQLLTWLMVPRALPQTGLKYRQPCTERKLRLFACNCVRQEWTALLDGRSRHAVEVAEMYADGETTENELLKAKGGALEVRGNGPHQNDAAAVCERDMDHALQTICHTEPLPGGRQMQTIILRDVFNPFHAPFDASWRTELVKAIASEAYGRRTLPDGLLVPDRLAVLADALDDAGCDDAILLAHLRDGGYHWRGCWALDLAMDNP